MTEPFRFADTPVSSIEDLLKLCQQFPDEAVNYLIREDFEKWLAYVGKTKLANYAQQARQSSVSNEEKLQLFIANCQRTSTNTVRKQPEKSQESVNFVTKIFQSMKSIFVGNKQNTQEQKLSTK
ncbi:MAG: hypothetical protein QNJ34_14000 [Xenococcaceae cyanobacterium MO_188.B29]|nr:hypothetical protein [Xenococcaceae cyanobacterium MO_188.B29]